MRQRQPILRKALLLFTYTISALFSLSSHLSVHAQTFQPVLTVQSGNSFADGKALYVYSGGTREGTIAQQSFMIDLSVSWNTTSPAYKRLAIGPGSNWIPSAMSADGQKWFVFVNGIGHVYDTVAGIWTQAFQEPGANVSGFFGRAATTDPATGLIYIPYGYLKPDGTWGMMIVDLTNNSYSGGNDMNFSAPDDNSYAVTWIPALKSLLYAYGGTMYLYNPTEGWRNFNGPQGFTAQDGFCLVTSSSGSKVVLFGGYSLSLNATIGDMFILDVPTLTWKKGTSSPPRDVRRYHACALSNDQLVVWGGDTGNWLFILPAEHLTMVYDLKTDKWVTNYVAPIAPVTTSKPSGNTIPSTTGAPSPSSTSKDGTSGISKSTAITIGAVGGVLAFGFMLGGMFIYRARMGRPKSSPPPSAPASTLNSSTLPYDDRHPGEGGGPNKRKETVQEGLLGSSPIIQGPQAYSGAFNMPHNSYDGIYAAQPMNYVQPMAYAQPVYTTQPMVYTSQPLVWSNPQDFKESGIMAGTYFDEPPRNPHT
ncbi:MAG: hypothetical protein J3Q66DRAFT_359953 [Benniella sp.]|nr:MAG: hypothetical protein J3Q66DRAFT_359953 [Benniella sp.]